MRVINNKMEKNRQITGTLEKVRCFEVYLPLWEKRIRKELYSAQTVVGIKGNNCNCYFKKE